MTTAISFRLVSGMSATLPVYRAPFTYTAIGVAGAQYSPTQVSLNLTPHSVKNWPSLLGVLVADSVWMMPDTS